MSLSRNIRYLRKKQGWGQDDLAEALGYKSYTTIQKWESGVSEPPLKKVHKLAELFKVDIDDLTKRDLEVDSMNKMPTESGERLVTDDDIKFALFGGRSEEITDEMFTEVKQFAHMVKLREDMKKKET